MLQGPDLALEFVKSHIVLGSLCIICMSPHSAHGLCIIEASKGVRRAKIEKYCGLVAGDLYC